MHTPIYLKFDKKTRYTVIKMPLKFKVKILKITFVIKYLRFGRFVHVTAKIRKLAPLGSRDQNNSIKFFPNNLPKDILLTLRKFGEPPKSRF